MVPLPSSHHFCLRTTPSLPPAFIDAQNTPPWTVTPPSFHTMPFSSGQVLRSANHSLPRVNLVDTMPTSLTDDPDPGLAHGHRRNVRDEEERFMNRKNIHRILRGISNLGDGRLLHCVVIQLGIELETLEGNLLIHMYGNLGAIEDARSVFEGMPYRDASSWNSIMSASLNCQCYLEVLALFEEMQHEGIGPDRISFKLVLRSTAHLGDLDGGRYIHHFITIKGMESGTGICTALLYAYGKCGAFKEARFLFDNMADHDEFAWVTMNTAYAKEGYDADMLELYKEMLKKGQVPNKIILSAVLEACGNLQNLEQGKVLHEHINQSSYASDLDLTSGLIMMYARCDALPLALSVFKSSVRTVGSYNALLMAYVEQGHYNKCLECFWEMLADGITPDVATYTRVLRACALVPSLDNGRIIHSCIVKNALEKSPVLEISILSMYSNCGEIDEAYRLFNQVKDKNGMTWNTMITSCAQHGHPHRCIQLFEEMQMGGIYPVKTIFSAVLHACANVGILEAGRMVHACLINFCLEMDVAMSSSLINMYGKCGALNDACFVFAKIQDRNVIHWTCMIAMYIQHGRAKDALQVFWKMQEMNVKPNLVTFVNVLSACASLGALVEGQLVYACILESELEADDGLLNAVLNMYSKCGALIDLHWVFHMIRQKNVLSYNIVIAAYAQEDYNDSAIQIFKEMQHINVVPDKASFINVLHACDCPEMLEKGKDIHCNAIQRGFDSVITIATALISMYGKCGALEEAHCVFNKIKEKNVVSWTAIITAYVQQGCGQEGIELTQEMKREGIFPDAITLVSILGAYANLGLVAEEDVIQALSSCKFESNILLANALITMYGKCGKVEEARSVFDKMHERSVATWNAMIFVYGHHAYCKEALALLQKMLEERVSPDELTWMFCLISCSRLGALCRGRKLHDCIIKCGYELNTGVRNALINMYGKCGASAEAFDIFNNMKRDVVSWNAMLACFSQVGQAEEALEFFEQMIQEGAKPDDVTFINVLSACSHAGLVAKGSELFKSMIDDHAVIPTLGHYGCMVDLFGKSGDLDAAEDLICSMPVPATVLIWMTLLGASRNLGDIKHGERASKYLSILAPNNGAPYILLANIYATKGRWDKVQRLREIMSKQGIRKQPGCSMIEVNDEIHSFFPRDSRHPDCKAIYAKLDSLNSQLKEQGYVPDTRLVLHEVDEETKKYMLCHHSERLALSFGLINSVSRTPLLIVKNLRMCADCHAAFKCFSIILERIINLRDANRFHCFQNGVCSCGDFW